jgi:hypothetical protein
MALTLLALIYHNRNIAETPHDDKEVNLGAFTIKLFTVKIVAVS